MRYRALVLILALFASACGGATTPTSAPAAADSGVHLLVALEGNLSVKRQGWSDYTPALFGMVLHSGDLLRLEGTAQATIACADLTVARASGGVSSVPCTVIKPVLVYGSSLINPTRADAPADIPIVLSPRKTRLLSARPTIRWTPIAGVSTYKVSVRGPNLTWSTEVTDQTTLVYPDVAPPLTAGAAYNGRQPYLGRGSRRRSRLQRAEG